MEYFAILAGYPVVYLEACENYQKQSYRNRCYILSASGKEMLQVPVVHEGGTYSIPIRDIRIDYSTPWVVRTWRCLDAAYCSSAFYGYYRDGLHSIFESRPEKLWDLNLSIIRYLCSRIGITPEIRFTDDYRRTEDEDFRSVIHPKSGNGILSGMGLEKPYWQVFGDRFGFVPGLSVLDLLFNEGPERICCLKR